jgi:hypothetical protein
MDRYNDFLSENLPRYLYNDLIHEIIITDENGNDIEKIKESFADLGDIKDKLVLIKNESRLGPFLNKIKACSFAKKEWIALIDSDNFADYDYFLVAKDYLETNQISQKNIILAPSKANPSFDFTNLANVYKKGCGHVEAFNLSLCMNTGNYIINKYLIEKLDISEETDNIKKSPACDVIFMNTLFFEQLDLHMHVVPHLEYQHVVHAGSIYLNTCDEFPDFNKYVYVRYDHSFVQNM